MIPQHYLRWLATLTIQFHIPVADGERDDSPILQYAHLISALIGITEPEKFPA